MSHVAVCISTDQNQIYPFPIHLEQEEFKDQEEQVTNENLGTLQINFR